MRWLQYAIYGSVVLYFGRNIFIPISFALLISFILYPICAWLEKKGAGKLMAIILSITFLVVLGLLAVALLVYQFADFLEEWPAIQSKLSQAVADLSAMIEVLGLSKAESEIISRLSDQSGRNFLTILRNTISASAFSIVLLVLIPVYAVLILYYRQYWMKILSRLFPSENTESLREMITLNKGVL